MAIVRLYDNDGDDGDDGSSWALAKATLQSALTAAGAGGEVWMHYLHQETYSASQTLTSPGTIDSVVSIIVVDNADDSYHSNAEGSYNYEATGAAVDVTLIGFASFYGIYFLVGDDFISTNSIGFGFVFEDSKISLSVGNSQGQLKIGAYVDNPSFFSMNNVLLDFVTPGYILTNNGIMAEFRDTTIISVSSSLDMIIPAVRGTFITFRDCDLSGWLGGDFITPNAHLRIKLLRCKLPAGWVILGGALEQIEDFVILEHCDTADDQDMFQYYYYFGSVVKATNCYRTASSVEYSAKIVSLANTAEFIRPLRFKLCEVYTAANPTLTVEYISEVTFQNDEFWIEIEYPDETDLALGQVDKSNRMADIQSTPANQTTSTEGWTEDLTEIKQKSEVTISGGGAGIHTVWACLAKPASIVYVDPDVAIS